MVRILPVRLEFPGLNLSMDTGYLIHRSCLSIGNLLLGTQLVTNQAPVPQATPIKTNHVSQGNESDLIFLIIINIYKNL